MRTIGGEVNELEGAMELAAHLHAALAAHPHVTSSALATIVLNELGDGPERLVVCEEAFRWLIEGGTRYQLLDIRPFEP
jgi:hypothetical protein